MKIITLNSHSLEETDYEEKLKAFVEGIYQEKPDVIALQEVNQTRTAKPVDAGLLELSGYIPCETGAGLGEAVIREDNHGYRVVKMLEEKGLAYSWTCVFAKLGYGKYDEGLALFSRCPVLDSRQFFITGSHDYQNWKTRKALGILAETERGPEWFYSVHMGWWKDEEEPFEEQWGRIDSLLRTGAKAPIWLMGDFNSPSSVPDEGYEMVKRSGWQDAYEMAGQKDDGITVDHSIDGWKDKKKETGMRIDYIWTDRKVPVRSSCVIFNGKNYPVVSDHFGILAECGDAHTQEHPRGNEE